MAKPPNAHIDGPEAFSRSFPVSRETLDRLATYAGLLKQWQKTINLVAPSTVEDIWHRHFADSAQIWGLAPTHPEPPPLISAGSAGEAKAHWLDIGSGAGFPGLVIAILGAELGRTRHTLVESDNRKAAFLREAARVTGVAVDILCTRIESGEIHAKVGEVNCVTARALAPLPRLAGLAAPYFVSGTVGFFLKGREVAAELEEAARTWDFQFELKPSVTDPEGRVLLLKALKVKTEG